MLDDAAPASAPAQATNRERSEAEMRRITTAVIVSALGTWSYNVAIAVYAYQVTDSSAWVAAATVGRYVPALFIASLGSRWTSRFSRRSVAIGADITCAVTMLVLTALTLAGGSSIPVLVVAIALASISSGVARVQSAATLSLAADVVLESDLLKKMALITTSEAVATAAGPALASGVLLFAAPEWLFLLNAASFVVSAILLLGVRDRVRPKEEAPHRHVSASARSTVIRTVWPLIGVRTIAAFVYGADIVLLAVIATENLRSETTGYGWLLAAAGVGGLLVALFLRRWEGTGRVLGATTLGMVLYALPLALFVLAPAILPSLAVQIVRGIGCVLVVTLVIAALQRAVPSQLSQEIFGATHSSVLLGTAAGSLAAPLLVSWLGLSTTLWVLALIPVLLHLLLLPWLRRFDDNAQFSSQALDPVVSTLRGLTLFQDASRWTLIEVADKLEPIGVEAGKAVVTEGEDADALYVLVSGEVQVTAGAGDTAVVLRDMQAPSYFGEIGILHRMPRTATVSATTRATLWRIPAVVFLDAASQAGVSGALNDSVRLRLRNTPGDRAALES